MVKYKNKFFPIRLSKMKTFNEASTYKAFKC